MFVGILIFIYFMWMKRDIWVERFLTSKTRLRHSVIKQNETIVKEPTDSLLMDSSSKEDRIETILKEKIPTKSNDSQKLNLRVRKTKMNFNQEPSQKKKRRSSLDLPNKDESSPSPSVKKRSHSRAIIRKENTQNSPIHLSNYNDIAEQLRRNLKARSRDRDFYKILTNITGLNKNKLNEFIFKKNDEILTLKTFISLLDSFHLMILIVPKEI